MSCRRWGGRAWRALMVAWLASAPIAAGCGSHEVEVGEAIEAMVRLDLSSCYGEGTRCEDLPPPTVLELPSDPQTKPGTCALSELPHQIAWSAGHRVGMRMAAAVGPSSFWVAIAGVMSSIYLSRYDAVGVALPELQLDMTGDHFLVFVEGVSLAAGSEDRAFIGLTLSVTERNGWSSRTDHVLLEVDAWGQQISDPLRVDGVEGFLRVAVDAAGGLLLSATGRHGLAVLGKLDAERRVQWIQTGLPLASVSQLLGDMQHRTLVTGSAASADPYLFDTALALIDEQGNVAWEVRCGPDGHLAVPHADGTSVVLCRPEGALSFADGGWAASKLSAAGTPIWSHRMPDVHGVRAVADSDGSTLYMEPADVVRLDRDGGCTRRRIDITGELLDPALHRAPDGTLYFIEGASVGVLTP